MSVRFRVAFRRFQLRFLRRFSIGWIAFLAYATLLLGSSIFSDRGLLTTYQLWSQKEKLQRQISEIGADVLHLEREVRNFENDPRTLERYAREELHLVGENEIQYIFQ